MDGTLTTVAPATSPETNERSVETQSENSPTSIPAPTGTPDASEDQNELKREPKRTLFGDVDNRSLNPYLFQPGQSGNPEGRPKGSKNKITLYKILVEQGLREDAAPHMQEVLAQAVRMAKKGNVAMIKLLLELHMSKSGDIDDRTTDDKITININQMKPAEQVIEVKEDG